MSQINKAKQFADLHVKGSPVLLYNAWDAGSAKTIVAAGAKAIATSSWAVAAAQGYADGENIPLGFFNEIVARIVAAVEVPVSADFESGYSEDEAVLATNIRDLLKTGIVGINFEDRVVKGQGLYPVERQASRIVAIRGAAEAAGVPLIINARTDLFLGRGTPNPVDSVDAALERAAAYAKAGASSFFIPGLTDEKLIRHIAENAALPVNFMMMDSATPAKKIAALGVARISWGNIPYADAHMVLKQQATAALS